MSGWQNLAPCPWLPHVVMAMDNFGKIQIGFGAETRHSYVALVLSTRFPMLELLQAQSKEQLNLAPSEVNGRILLTPAGVLCAPQLEDGTFI
ncbi:unnamed protein product [Caretta caretta]